MKNNFFLAGMIALVAVGGFFVPVVYSQDGNVSEIASSEELLIDEVLSESLIEWRVNYPSGNPAFTYEEIVSPYDESTALRTSVVGNSYSPCNQPNISKTYSVGGNTDTTQLKAYLAFTSTMEPFTFPYVVVEIYDESNERAGSQIYYGKGVVGSWYKSNHIDQNPGSFTEFPVSEGDVTIDLSVIGEKIDFSSIKLTLANYACVGQNSVTFDHLRVINGVIGGEVDDEPEEGTAENPSKISTCQEFQAISDNLDWHYELLNDIDCSETENWNSGSGFSPISGLKGSLIGNNFTVSDIFINTSGSGGVFLANNGSIKSINFRNVDISGGGYTGGLVNDNSGLIEQASITGKVTCGSQQCGGFAGKNSGTISGSWADIEIAGPNYVGIIVGHSHGGQVENCYSKGKMNSSSQSGGLVGLNESTKVVNSYSASVVNKSQSNGGLIGWMYQHSSQSGSYWNKEVSGLDIMCGSSGSTCTNDNGLTEAEMKTADSFVGWDFESIWAIDPDKNDGYPYLAWQTSFTEKDTVAPVITLNGPATVEVILNDSYTDQGATAADDVDGDLSADIVTVSDVDTSTVGSYTVTYNVSDSAGNAAAEVVRTVVVKEEAKEEPEPSSGGGGSSFFTAPKQGTFQSYDPNTGITTEADPAADEEEVEVLGEEEEFIELSEAELVAESGRDKTGLFANVLGTEDEESEAGAKKKHGKILEPVNNELSEIEEAALVNFMVYGTASTRRLGEGERAGVLNSYKSAFGKLPRTVAEWEDVIKIANGRWPGETSASAEEMAEEKFMEIYLRSADRNNPHDDAAVVIIAYGLRPTDRNMDSEKSAILIFKGIFGDSPSSATDWDIVRAIAYSGATR